MKSFRWIQLIGVLCAICIASPAYSAMSFSINHEMGPGIPVAIALEKFADLVKEKSGGDMKVKVFHSGELGGEREMFNYMKVGSVEMGLSGSALIAAVAPEYGALDMPYLFESQEHLRKVVGGPIGDDLRSVILERQGIRIIGFMDRAPRHLTTSKKVVRKPSDLKGIKIRIREIPVQVEAWRAMGASPVPMAFSEVYTALQTGTIDAQENPVEVTYSYSLYEVQDNLILTGHVREVQWLIASEVFWKRLDENQKKIINEAASEALPEGDRLTWEKESGFIEKIRAAKLKVVELSSEEIRAFMDKVQSVPEKFEGKWKDGLVEQIKNAR